MTAVLLLGDISSTGTIGGVRTETIGVTEADSPVSLDVIRARLATAGAVLAVYPSWRSVAATRLIRVARGALATDRIAAISLPLPPLAVSLVADQLTYLAPHVAPGLLASVAYRLPADIVSGAWVRSVTGLLEIKVPLSAHLTSYLPGAFLVTASPEQAVYRIKARRPLPETTSRAAVLVARQDGDLRWIESRLVPSLGAPPVIGVPPQPFGATFWGTRKYVEFAAPNGDPTAMNTIVRSTLCRVCPWCSEPTALPNCPFCEMSQPATAVNGTGRPARLAQVAEASLTILPTDQRLVASPSANGTHAQAAAETATTAGEIRPAPTREEPPSWQAGWDEEPTRGDVAVLDPPDLRREVVVGTERVGTVPMGVIAPCENPCESDATGSELEVTRPEPVVREGRAGSYVGRHARRGVDLRKGTRRTGRHARGPFSQSGEMRQVGD